MAFSCAADIKDIIPNNEKTFIIFVFNSHSSIAFNVRFSFELSRYGLLAPELFYPLADKRKL
jgi:hypothetical protein